MTPTPPEGIAGSRSLGPRPVALALGAVAGMLAAGTAALWGYYGTAVFYETIVAGINAWFLNGRPSARRDPPHDAAINAPVAGARRLSGWPCVVLRRHRAD